jgi:Peptidase family S41
MKIVPIIILAVFSLFASCEKDLIKTRKTNSALVIYNQASNFIKTHSAFLNVKHLNWDSVSLYYSSKVFESMSDDSLYQVINSLLLTLEDGHALLYYKEKDVSVWDYTKGYPVNFDKQLLTDYYWLNSQKKGPLTLASFNNVGYVYYPSFGDKIQENDMDGLIDFIAGTKGLIIDIRNNGGGDGSNSSTILSRFIDKETYFGKQLVKSGPGLNDFTESKFTLSPSSSPKKYLNNKIIILTNRGDASAAAFFAGYAKVLNNISSVGDKTGGAGGVGTSMQLGNGWQIVVSATLGIDANGNIIENGIEPNLKINQTIADSLQHKDAILDAALLLF